MVREQSAVLTAIDEIVLDQEVVAAFIRVDSPAAIVAARDIVHSVVTNASARSAARVDAGQIAEQTLPDVVDVIIFDDVVLGMIRPEVLNRSGRDTALEQVVNVVVNNLVVGVVANEHARRFWREPSAMGDHVVSHGDPLAVGTLWHGRFTLLASLCQLARPVRLPREEVTNSDSPRSDVRDLVARNLDI